MTTPEEDAQTAPVCTCPFGWLIANFGYHRGPKACPQYDIDQHQRQRRNARPAPSADVEGQDA